MSRFTVINCNQREPAWFSARAGKVTGSRADAVRAGANTAKRKDYILQLAVERLTGLSQEDGYQSRDMLRGIELEPLALAAYETHSGNLVQKVGFLSLREVMAGCSPDGVLNDFEGLVSFKMPKSTTQVEYCRRQRLPPEYVPQAVHELWVSGARYYDFCSVDPRLDAIELGFMCVRVERVELEREIASYETEISRFLAEVTIETQELLALRGRKMLG